MAPSVAASKVREQHGKDRTNSSTHRARSTADDCALSMRLQLLDGVGCWLCPPPDQHGSLQHLMIMSLQAIAQAPSLFVAINPRSISTFSRSVPIPCYLFSLAATCFSGLYSRLHNISCAQQLQHPYSYHPISLPIPHLWRPVSADCCHAVEFSACSLRHVYTPRPISLLPVLVPFASPPVCRHQVI